MIRDLFCLFLATSSLSFINSSHTFIDFKLFLLFLVHLLNVQSLYFRKKNFVDQARLKCLNWILVKPMNIQKFNAKWFFNIIVLLVLGVNEYLIKLEIRKNCLITANAIVENLNLFIELYLKPGFDFYHCMKHSKMSTIESQHYYFLYIE